MNTNPNIAPENDPEDTENGFQWPRPYFLPPEIDYETLPSAVRAALQEIVTPSYHELVICATGALERSAGVTLSFLLTLEVLDQFALAEQVDFGDRPKNKSRAERDRQITQHLKLVTRKQSVLDFLLRLKTARSRMDPLASA